MCIFANTDISYPYTLHDDSCILLYELLQSFQSIFYFSQPEVRHNRYCVIFRCFYLQYNDKQERIPDRLQHLMV